MRPSSRRATDRGRPRRRRRATAVERRVESLHAEPGRDLVAVERLRAGEVQRPVERRRASSATAATAAMSSRVDPRDPARAGRQHDATARDQRRAGVRARVAKNDGCRHGRGNRRRREPAFDRAVVAVQAGCRGPAIGMFETLTMCSTPAASAASIAFVSSVDLLPASATTRGTRLATPAQRGASDAGSRQVGEHDLVDASTVGVGMRAAHEGAHRRRRRAVSARTPPARRDRPSHRSRAPSRAGESRRSSVQTRARAPSRSRYRPRADVAAGSSRARCGSSPREGWRENLSGHITWATPDGGHVVQPVGHLVGGGARLRHPPPRRRRRDRRRRVGRHAGRVPAHRAAPRPRRRRRSSCTTIRTTRRCSRAMGESPRIVHQNSCIFDGELAFVDEYGGDRGRGRRQVARRPGRRRERHPARAPRRDRHRADASPRRATRP